MAFHAEYKIRPKGFLCIVPLLMIFLGSVPSWAGQPSTEGDHVAAERGQGVDAEADAFAPRIYDNSFLIEEGYNQEDGVIHHIQNFMYLQGRGWMYKLTDEWPVPTRKHQLSVTVPVIEHTSPDLGAGIGDVALNYRYQAILPKDESMAFAPRLTVIFPSGDYKKSYGYGAVGVQVGLPFSINIGKHFASNVSTSAIFTPGAKYANNVQQNAWDYYAGGNIIAILRPNFDMLVEVAYSNLDSIGDSLEHYREQTLLINPGLRGAINFKCGLQMVMGFAVPIGIGPSLGNYGPFFYLSFEHPLWKPK